MDVGSQGVNCQIEAVSDDENQNENNDSRNGISYHASHLIKYGGNNAGRKSQGQKSGVGQDVTKIRGNSVCAVQSL